MLAAPSIAARPIEIDLPAQHLGDALISLGSAAGISIGLTDARLATMATRRLHGRMSVDEALARLLNKLPATVVKIDAATYRVVPHAPVPAVTSARRRPPTTPAPSPREIVVTGSKRAVPLALYPGSAAVLGEDALGAARRQPGGDAIASLLPVVSGTQLGPGRNKLFIRGVADSSFTGPTQATVGEYLGDTRLTYNAPDPDLRLYDIASVEVLEGPQGSLYGAGSLGGILRIVPVPVDLGTASGEIELGRSTSARGADGSDVAALVNLPLAQDRIGVRAVAYRVQDGGYIDNLSDGRTNINRTRTTGVRVRARAILADDWTIEAGAAVQGIDSRDSQYAERDAPPLSRREVLAQPFDNDYALGSVVVTHDTADTKLISSTGVVHHVVGADDDFSPSSADPILFHQRNGILLLSNETRLAHGAADGAGWLLGTSVVFDDEDLTRTLGPPGTSIMITGVRNRVLDGAVFGEGTLALTTRLLVTAGGRFSYAHLTGEGLDPTPGQRPADIDRTEVRFVPSLGLLWHGSREVTAFARYGEGFRPGGLSTGFEDATLPVQRFRGDTVHTIDIGARLGDTARPISGSIGFSYARWLHIQADLINDSGLPLTANIGDGRILAAEGTVSLRPGASWVIDASLFMNDSKLTDPLAGFQSPDDDLPNIAHSGARLGVRFHGAVLDGLPATLAASARLVGRSRLGAGESLDISQGGYVDTSVLGRVERGRVERGRVGLSIELENLLDTRGNRFSFGNPYDVAQRMQITPLRPRTIRIGVDARL